MSHTPGPWYRMGPLNEEECCIAGGLSVDVVAASADEGATQGVSVLNGLSVEDADLMAAAPDLLDVAKTLIRYCSARDGSLASYQDWMQCFIEDGSTITEVVEKAVAAIAKAKGRS